ncbi:MAG: D-alanine--D-alanine ligase A, partial [Sciscionella sp.]
MSQDEQGPRRLKVAVVFGGRSSEHTVSCVSAGSVLANLDTERFELIPVGITTAGAWVLGPEHAQALQISGEVMPSVTAGAALALPADPTAGGLVSLAADDSARVFSEVDVVFPVLHGAYGEDGTLQGLLELAGIPYVGAGVFASAAAMDKEFSKKLLAAEGIPGGDYRVIHRGESTVDDSAREELGLPVFVKPARAGSSTGISRITDWAELDEAVAVARRIDPK